MLQSGIKAPMAIRVYGDDLKTLADAAMSVAEQLKASPLVNAGTVNPDIVLGKPYVEFTVDREAASRYGMSAAMVNQVIETALGGMNLINTVEGRERYPVRLRYNRDLREQIDQLSRLPVVTSSGAAVPLGELATLETTWGPGAINSENARLVAHVSFMTNGAAGDLESVSAIEEQLREAQLLPPSDPKHLGVAAGLFAGSGRQLSQSDRSQSAIDVDHSARDPHQPAADLPRSSATFPSRWPSSPGFRSPLPAAWSWSVGWM